MLGFDPRVQLLHDDDALEVLRRATLTGRGGTVNVGGEGVLLLSQMVRRAGRVPIPVPAPAVQVAGLAVRRAGLLDFSQEQLRFLRVRPGRGHHPAADRVRLHARASTPWRRSTTSSGDGAAARLRHRTRPRVRRAERRHPGRRPDRGRGRRRGRAGGREWVTPGCIHAARRRRAAAPAPGPLPDPPPEPGHERAAADWERRVAGGLAFLRRRITGDYEVDDFGFDQDLTEHVLAPAVPPAVREVVPGRGDRPARTSRTTGGALVVANHSGTRAAGRA